MVPCRADSSVRHGSFYPHAWSAIAKVGLPGISLQDLRHAGNTLNADAVSKAPRAALGKTGKASGTEVARSPGQVP